MEEFMLQREAGLEPRLQDFTNPADVENFIKEQVPPVALFDEGITFMDFLSWFYEEFPLVTDKHLTVISESKVVPFGFIPLNNKVILNHENKTVEVHFEYPDTGGIGEITLGNIPLYQMLTVSQKEMDEHLQSLAYNGDDYV